ncbi:MAG: hypothetical protein JW943_04735 [Deltaproteobacteria bacterium]|nr:hypothetical protein [Deltaproteobacteria bacterium]
MTAYEKLKVNGLEQKKYFNYDLFCTEFTIYSAANNFDQSDPFLFAQSFSDRIKAWWPTNAGLEMFIEGVNGFFKTNQPVCPSPEAGMADCNLACEVYLYRNNYQIDRIRFKDFIDTDAMKDLFQSPCPVHLFRIARAGVDFYFDVEAHENGVRRAGIVTNLQAEDAIGGYIQATHKQRIQEDALKNIIRDVLSCMPR